MLNLGWPLTPVTGVPIRRGEGEWCEKGGRDWSDVSMSQGTLRIAIWPPEAGKEAWNTSLRASRRNQHRKHLDFRLLGSGLWEVEYLLLATRFQVVCYGCPRKLMHLLGHPSCLWFVLIISAWPSFASWPRHNYTPFCRWTSMLAHPQLQPVHCSGPFPLQPSLASGPDTPRLV